MHCRPFKINKVQNQLVYSSLKDLFSNITISIFTFPMRLIQSDLKFSWNSLKILHIILHFLLNHNPMCNILIHRIQNIYSVGHFHLSKTCVVVVDLTMLCFVCSWEPKLLVSMWNFHTGLLKLDLVFVLTKLLLAQSEFSK